MRRIRRSAVWGFGGLAVALVVLDLAAGWVFASKIYAEALEARPPQRNHGVVVLDFDDATITLDGSDRTGLETPGVISLQWDSGFAILGEIRGFSGGAVVRQLTRTTGNPPVCSTPDTSGCTEVDIDAWIHPSDPGTTGLDFHVVQYPGPSGELSAWLVEPDSPANGGWVIHVHGWRADRREALRTLPIYAAEGWRSLVIEYRNDEDAPSDPDGLYRFGRTEWADLEAAIEFAGSSGAERVVLSAYSTGGAIALAHHEREVSPIDGMILDAPNADFGAVVKERASQRTIPGTPLPVPGPVTSTAMAIADLRWDVSWDEINYAARAESIEVPVLIFHGDADGTVPVEVSQRMQAANPDRIRLVVTQGAGHVMSWNVNPSQYGAEVVTFLADLAPGGTP